MHLSACRCLPFGLFKIVMVSLTLAATSVRAELPVVEKVVNLGTETTWSQEEAGPSTNLAAIVQECKGEFDITPFLKYSLSGEVGSADAAVMLKIIETMSANGKIFIEPPNSNTELGRRCASIAQGFLLASFFKDTIEGAVDFSLRQAEIQEKFREVEKELEEALRNEIASEVLKQLEQP